MNAAHPPESPKQVSKVRTCFCMIIILCMFLVWDHKVSIFLIYTCRLFATWPVSGEMRLVCFSARLTDFWIF